MALSPGTVLQRRYRIGKMVNQGGMGIVYRGYDQTLQISVAIKEMIAPSGVNPITLAQRRQQFQLEASILARLQHPNLVRVTDFFEEQGNAYLVMDFVEGVSLEQRVQQSGPLAQTEAHQIAEQILNALELCHQNNILHRDIKPSNILIRPNGQAVLIDFGLVKVWNPQSPPTQPVIKNMGTPEYAPPEQAGSGQGYTDRRSDLYSLGATLYYALTGQTPPQVNSRLAHPAPLSVRAHNPRIGDQWEQVVRRATEMDTANRFANAAEMRAALTATPAAPTRLSVASLGPWWMAAGLTIAFMVIAVMIVTHPPRPRPMPTRMPSPTPSHTPTVVTVLANTPAPTRTYTSTRTPPPPTSTYIPSPTSTRMATPTRTRTPTPTPLPAPIWSALVIKGPLNLRSGPGTTYNQIGEVYECDCLAVYNSTGEWLNIAAPDGRSAWIAAEFTRTGLNSSCEVSHTVNAHFRADQYSLSAGGCTFLRWDVDGIKAVYLDRTGRAGHDSQEVCPAQTQTFTLKVVLANNQVECNRVTIQVSGR